MCFYLYHIFNTTYIHCPSEQNVIAHTGLTKVLLYCIVLYCIVLYCIVLYCIVLYCIVLYCIVLYCIVLYCIVLYCTPSVEPSAYDTISSPASATLKPLTPSDVRATTISTVPSDALISAAASGNEQVAMAMLLSDERANVKAHNNKCRTCLHWAGNSCMTYLA